MNTKHDEKNDADDILFLNESTSGINMQLLYASLCCRIPTLHSLCITVLS